MRDFLLGAASLLIAIVLWLQIQPLYNPDREREFAVSLAVQNTPSGLVPVRAPETLKVVASGTAAEIEGLESSEFEAVVDASKAKAGDNELIVEVKGPSRATLNVRAVKPKLRITLARLGSVSKEVELLTTGLPPRDLLYDTATISPETVTLTGPETMLNQVQKVRVTLDLSKIRPRSDFTLGVEALDAEGRPVSLITAEPTEVVVSPAVGSAPTMKRVIINPVFVGQLPFGSQMERYEIKPSQVELTGPSPDLARVTTIETEPISLDKVTAQVTREVSLVIPAGLRVRGRALVRVTLTPKAPTPAPSPTAPTVNP